MGPSFIRSCAGDRCATGNSPTQTRRLNLKWNYSLDGWLLRQAWQQRRKKYRQSSKWNINSPPRFYSLRTDSRLLWHQNRTLTHPDAEFLKTPTFTYCSPLRDAWMINGGLGGQVVTLTQRECIILTWLMIKECVLAAGLSSINTRNHYLWTGPEPSEQPWSDQRDRCPHSPSHPHQSWSELTGSGFLTAEQTIITALWREQKHAARLNTQCSEHHLQRWHENERRKCQQPWVKPRRRHRPSAAANELQKRELDLFIDGRAFKCGTSAGADDARPPFRSYWLQLFSSWPFTTDMSQSRWTSSENRLELTTGS